MLTRTKKALLCLIFFFSSCFTTTFIGPSWLRLNLFRALFLISAFIFFLSGIIKKKIFISSGNNKTLFVFNVVWLGYALFVSVLLSNSIIASIESIIYIAIGFFVFLFVLDADSSNEGFIYLLLDSFLLGIVVNNIIALYEIYSSNYLFTLAVEKIPTFTKYRWAVTFYANPNNMCTMLTFATIIAYALFLYRKSFLNRLLYFFIIVSSLYIMIADNSESTFISAVIGLFIFTIIHMRLNKHYSVKFLLLFATIVGVLIFYFDDLYSFIFGRVNSITDETSSLGMRLSLSLNAIRNMIDYCFLGVGAGMSKYYVEIGYVNDVHNWFTQVMVDYGLLFFVFYLYIYVFQIRIFKRSLLLEKNRLKHITIGYFVILVMFFLFNISSSNNFTTEFIWCIWGIGYYLCDVLINTKLKDGSIQKKNRLGHGRLI